MAHLRRYLNNHGLESMEITGHIEGNLFVHSNGFLVWDMINHCPVSVYCDEFVYDGIGG